MLGLPKMTELYKQLPKKSIYAKFTMNTAARAKLDTNISKIAIVNEISPVKVNIAEGEQIKNFFVVHVIIKKRDFDAHTIAAISKLIPQNMLFVLEFGNEEMLAVYRTKLFHTSWQPKGSCLVELKGLNLDSVWKNIIMQIGGVHIEHGNTLDEQIALDDKRQKLVKEIERLDKQARKEKQPKKKFEMVQQINELKNALEDI